MSTMNLSADEEKDLNAIHIVPYIPMMHRDVVRIWDQMTPMPYPANPATVEGEVAITSYANKEPVGYQIYCVDHTQPNLPITIAWTACNHTKVSIFHMKRMIGKVIQNYPSRRIEIRNPALTNETNRRLFVELGFIVTEGWFTMLVYDPNPNRMFEAVYFKPSSVPSLNYLDLDEEETVIIREAINQANRVAEEV